ncbi:MAG: hypothetical protein FWE95_03385 [Planctomycetaceae bacterium]|nr:hypothetical protein [Planctomycetaceae bacterium]
MIADTPVPKPPKKKVKWYWDVLVALGMLWAFGGLNVLLLQDIPMLLFILGIWIPLFYIPAVILREVLPETPPSSTTPTENKPPIFPKLQKHFPTFQGVCNWCWRGLQRLWHASWYTIVLLLAVLAWIAFACTVACALLLLLFSPFPISPQTTYLTEPLATEYYGIDYRAFIERQLDPGVPPEENGFRLLAEAFGRPLFDKLVERRQTFTDEHWHRLCTYLELSTDIEPTLTFTGWNAYTATLTPEEQEIVKTTWEGSMLPWSEEAMPIVRQWLDEHEVALDVFVVAIQKPALYAPPMFDGIVDTVYTNEMTQRMMSGNLWIRTRYRLALGEIDKAWEDVLVGCRLTEHRRRAVWDQMSSFGTTEGGNRYAEAVMLHSDWSSGEILRRFEEIAPFMRPIGEDETRLILRNERLMYLNFWRELMHGQHAVEADGGQRHVGFYEKAMMRLARLGNGMVEINKRFDELEQRVFSDAPIPNDERDILSLREFFKIFGWYGLTGASSITVSRSTVDSLLSDADRWQVRPKQHQAGISLTRLVFALEAYHRDNEKYPESLDDLLGRTIDEMPLDPFSSNPAGESFRYVLEEQGFLLYSVGPNGIDEDGRGYSDAPRGDDIRRRLPVEALP